METNKGIETFFAATRQQWRSWLEKNSRTKKEVCLIVYHKKSRVNSVSHQEAVEEALCFGWIDSLANKRGPDSFFQRFSPRKPKSNWSQVNKERVSQLINQGLMTELGLKAVDMAKQAGKWPDTAET